MKSNNPSSHDDNALFIDKDDFVPPKIPFAGLATTFIAPTLLVVLPYFLNVGKESLQTLIIIALVLLAILLFVMLIMTYFRLYNESFARQIIELKQNALYHHLNELERLNGDLIKRLDAFEK